MSDPDIPQPLRDLRAALAADGYDLSVETEAGGLLVMVTAGEQACADCLVPKPLMLNILRDRLGASAPSIRLVYPAGISG